MARFARDFYISPEWIRCRKAYAQSKGWLCERCAACGDIVPGDEVHHKIRLSRQNLSDPSIALNWDNLELLCKDCHLREHGRRIARTDAGGHVDIGELITRRR
ncbi:MAG: HNH endonuclease [Succinivibrionaceae bacterium]|nr:HNH endonuclease [Succinivibrionaceae bacterium]